MSLNACVYTCISTGGETRTPVQKMGRVVSYLLWAGKYQIKFIVGNSDRVNCTVTCRNVRDEISSINYK